MYVLSVIHPPANGAAFGKARGVGRPVKHKAKAAVFLASVLFLDGGIPVQEANRLSRIFIRKPVGTEWTHPGSGFTFRLDPAAGAPHPCPCGGVWGDGCGRLVTPDQHAYAHHGDAVCEGCWGDTVNHGCLPANTAHPAHPAEES